MGGLSRWNWPTIEGLGSYKGRLLHPAQWELRDDESVDDWADKTVGIIGVVSSSSVEFS